MKAVSPVGRRCSASSLLSSDCGRGVFPTRQFHTSIKNTIDTTRDHNHSQFISKHSHRTTRNLVTIASRNRSNPCFCFTLFHATVSKLHCCTSKMQEEVKVREVEVDPNEETLEDSVPLESLQPNSVVTGRAVSRGSKIQRQMRQETKLNQLMPYTLTLTLEDVPQCEIVENEAFPPHERCSHEKVCFWTGFSIGYFFSMLPWAA